MIVAIKCEQVNRNLAGINVSLMVSILCVFFVGVQIGRVDWESRLDRLGEIGSRL